MTFPVCDLQVERERERNGDYRDGENLPEVKGASGCHLGAALAHERAMSVHFVGSHLVKKKAQYRLFTSKERAAWDREVRTLDSRMLLKSERESEGPVKKQVGICCWDHCNSFLVGVPDHSLAPSKPSILLRAGNRDF